MNESIRSGMAVLDVTLPTGYWIQQQKLDAYILSRRVRNLQRARYIHNKVLFYFDYVSKRKLENNKKNYIYSMKMILKMLTSFHFNHLYSSTMKTFALTLP